MDRRGFLAGTAAAVASALAGCAGLTGENGEDDDETPEGPPARVVESRLVREHEDTDEERVAVEGTVERTRDEEITYLEVRVEFRSADDEVLDSTVEHLADVTEGDRWPFVVEFPGVGEAAARVADHAATVVENP